MKESQGAAIAVLPDLIARQAARTPDRTAISWNGGEPWTYAELMQYADGVAQRLLARGVTRGEPVGLYLPRRPEMVAAAIGVMRAGAAYLPLDPVFPLQQLQHMTEIGRVRLLLAWRRSDAPELLASNRQLLELDSLDTGRALPAELPRLTGNDLAYVLFTSGSTGKPKGVRTLHRNLVNFLECVPHAMGITEDDVVGAFTTLAFDPVALDLYMPLLAGARLVLATEADQDDPDAAAALRRDHGITMLLVPPTQLQLLHGIGRLPELRGMKLWSGGEVLPRDLAERVLDQCDSLWNMYGPTETTVASTIHRVTRGSGPVPIGTTIANTSIYLLDDTRAPVAEDAVGEIWIGGAGVADGYLHDPERTADKFPIDPFAANGSHMYRTGDLGRWHDGLLYFHGRIDGQIKFNGFRIEPGEIEAAALAEPGIRQAAATACDLGCGDKRLVLYVVTDDRHNLAARLRGALRERLPAFVRLHHIEAIDSMPLTPNGKIDRKALPPPAALVDSGPAKSAAQAARINAARDGGDAWSPLVPIQPQGARAPLFLIHAVAGNVLNYVPLGRGLGVDQPVYGLQATGLDGVTPPIGCIPTMAACYITAIQRMQPRGPYFLGGGSMGGLIAYEMACQLCEQGETVGLLAMMDTYGPDCPAIEADGHTSLATRILRALIERPRRLFDRMRVRRARAAGLPLPHALRHREVQRLHHRALAGYRPAAYAGRILLFRSSNQPMASRGMADLGWTRYAQAGLEIIDLPGDHDSLIEQPELLRRLRKTLQQTQATPVA